MKQWPRLTLLLTLTVLIFTSCAAYSSLPAQTNDESVQTDQPLLTVVAKKVATLPFIENGIVSAYTKNNQHPENVVINAINGAKKTLDIAIFAFTQPGIKDAIIAAKNRGVVVRMITDKSEYKNSKNQTVAINTIRAAGIVVKQNTHSGLMHLKVSIIDNTSVLEGSFNYTVQASTQNDEGIWLLPFPAVAADAETQFERMWNDKIAFAVI